MSTTVGLSGGIVAAGGGVVGGGVVGGGVVAGGVVSTGSGSSPPEQPANSSVTSNACGNLCSGFMDPLLVFSLV
jgi:hypothetical protein